VRQPSPQPLCDPGDRNTTEDAGLCYGVMLVYSGSHRTDIEVDQNVLPAWSAACTTNGSAGSWNRGPPSMRRRRCFAALPTAGRRCPQRYQHFVRHNICRSPLRFTRRPVLINNWEATYFQFTTDTICRIAEKAVQPGRGDAVLDDGWFGKRKTTTACLGDWY
jgi:alpha-galactosidase